MSESNNEIMDRVRAGLKGVATSFRDSLDPDATYAGTEIQMMLNNRIIEFFDALIADTSDPEIIKILSEVKNKSVSGSIPEQTENEPFNHEFWRNAEE